MILLNSTYDVECEALWNFLHKSVIAMHIRIFISKEPTLLLRPYKFQMPSQLISILALLNKSEDLRKKLETYSIRWAHISGMLYQLRGGWGIDISDLSLGAPNTSPTLVRFIAHKATTLKAPLNAIYPLYCNVVSDLGALQIRISTNWERHYYGVFGRCHLEEYQKIRLGVF